LKILRVGLCSPSSTGRPLTNDAKVSRPCKFCSLYNVLLPNSRSANIGDLKLTIRSVEYAEPKIFLVLLNMLPFPAK
jgi:hypothetical protein